MYICETPVLLIFFNRPDTLKEVFESIRKAKPCKLYLAQDGPRKNYEDDIKKIDECRKIVENIDWDCDVYRNYSNFNQGCGIGPYNAINWIFSNEDKAIILEDDCIASLSFFTFCDEMLNKYEYDQRIFMITGCNFELETKDISESYFFGYSSTNCGWATWKRNWNYMDYKCSWINDSITFNYLNHKMKRISYSKSKRELRLFKDTYRKTHKGINLSYWDIQWQAIKYLNNQLAIIPSKNLITNIGLGPTSTHAKSKKIPNKMHDVNGEIHFCYNQRYELDFPLIHPKYIIENYLYDEKINNKISPSLIKKILIKLHMIRGD